MIEIVLCFILVALLTRVAVGFYLAKHDEDYVDDNSVVRKLIEWVNKFISKKK